MAIIVISLLTPQIDISVITSLISSVGFPICMCIFLFWAIGKLDDRHTEEVEKLRTSVDNNTKALLKLCQKLGVTHDE